MAKQNKKQIEELDYFAYLEEVYQALGLGDDVTEDKKTEIMDMIAERAEDRIINALMTGFEAKDFALLEEIMEERPDIDPMDVIIEISTHKPEMAQVLGDALDKLKEEFKHYSDLYDESMEKARKSSEEAENPSAEAENSAAQSKKASEPAANMV